MMEQISIWDLLGEKPETQQSEVWERIPYSAAVVALTEPTDYDGLPMNIDSVIKYPDKVAKGRVNRIPCLIGYVECVSGYNECFKELVPKFFKRTAIQPCPLKDYCINSPAGCEGTTWWCGRTKEEVR